MDAGDRYVDWSGHHDGAADCGVCETGYPVPCPCGGLVHGQMMQVPDDGYVQVTRCDRCAAPQAG